jgi:hypothetical protein
MNHASAPIRSIRMTAALASAAGILLLVSSPRLPAQTRSALPPMPPTSTANPNSLPAPIAGSPSGGNPSQHHKARVRYANGLLEVRADNSSLNQILRDISRQTGMSIVGGVADERVFGNYGPAAPATVLNTLLDGTRTNMLLKETATEAPAELMLTPQTGGASPPGPNSSSYDVTESEPELPLPGQAPPAVVVQPVSPRAVTPQRVIPSIVANPPAIPATATAPTSSATPSLPPTMPQPLNNVNGNSTNVSPTASTIPVVQSVPTDSLPTPSTAPSATGIVDAPSPPPQGSTTAGFTSQTPPDNNPNNPPGSTTAPPASQPKTPQQVYEELKQLQKQKQSAPAPQPTTVPQPPQSSSPPQL